MSEKIVKSHKSYKYRLYPNRTQARQLDFMFWQGRKVYNGALDMWQECREINGADPSLYDLRDYWCGQRKHEPDTIGELPYDTVDDLIRRLKKSYDNAYKRYERGDYTTRKNGSKNYGFPRFKNRDTFTGLGFAPVKEPMRLNGSDKWARLYLTNVGEIRARYHYPMPDEARVKWIMVTRDKAGKWWASLQCEFMTPEPVPSPKPAVGIDIGLVYALALSDGTPVECPKWYQDAQRERRVLMRKLDRQRRANNPDCYDEKGRAIEGKRPIKKSTRMKQTERALKTLDAKVTQQRWYWWHTLTDWLTMEYGLIAIEDLTLGFMLKNKHLAMHAQNASFGMFWELLTYKAADRGVEIVKVKPAYTSQTCSECGVVHADNRKTQATFCCVSCGHTENADINAAKNILRVALSARTGAAVGESEAIGSKLPYKGHPDKPVAAR